MPLLVSLCVRACLGWRMAYIGTLPIQSYQMNNDLNSFGQYCYQGIQAEDLLYSYFKEWIKNSSFWRISNKPIQGANTESHKVPFMQIDKFYGNYRTVEWHIELEPDHSKTVCWHMTDNAHIWRFNWQKSKEILIDFIFVWYLTYFSVSYLDYKYTRNLAPLRIDSITI